MGRGRLKDCSVEIVAAVTRGFEQSGIGREFSLEGMLDSFTQRKNVTVNLNTPPGQ